MEKGTVYKEYWDIDEELRKQITTPETNEERQAYFDFLEDCLINNVCQDCGCDIEFDETWMKDEVSEYQYSALCKDCQRHHFGR